MKLNIEVEDKVLLCKEDFFKLIFSYEPYAFTRQVNHYYSFEGILSHDVIRIREKNNAYTFTFKRKTNSQLFEYEKELSSLSFDEESIKLLNEHGINEPYKLIGSLETERFSIIIDEVAELSFDINHYNGITDYEVEYECLSEHDHVIAFGNILAKADIEFVPNLVSKFARFINSSTKKD